MLPPLTSHGFPVGTTVQAFPAQRWVPGMAPSGVPSDAAIVASDSTLTFRALEEPGQYVAFAGGRGVRFGVQEGITEDLAGSTGLLDRVGNLERVVSRFVIPSFELELLHDAADVLTRDMPGFDSNRYPYGLRRSGEIRVPEGAEEIVTDDLSRQSWVGMRFVPDDSVGNSGPERFNATSAGMSLEFLGILAQIEQRAMRAKLLVDVSRFADIIMQYQWPDDLTTARRGGFMLAPGDTSANTFSTANCGLGMLEAWRATQDPRYLESARKAADYLMVMADPNATYQSLHSVTPLNALPGGGKVFLNTINNADKITAVADMINVRGCELLYQMDSLFPDAGYWETGLAVLEFWMQDVLNGHDHFEPSANADATWVTVGSDNDNAFHFATDPDTRGTDGLEYLMAAAHRCRWNRTTLLEAWEFWRDQPYYDPASAFGAAWEANGRGAICLTGYMKAAGAFGGYWDTQGAGTLLELKADLDPASYRLSLEKIIPIGIRIGTIVDEDFKIVQSDPGFDDYWYATSGVVVRAQCAVGLARVMRSRAGTVA